MSPSVDVRSSINFPICKLDAVNRELDLPISEADYQWAGLLVQFEGVVMSLADMFMFKQ